MKNKSKPPIKITDCIFQTTEIEKQLSTSTDIPDSPKQKKVIHKWTKEEDMHLLQIIEKYGTKNWVFLSSFLPGRNAIQCSARYIRIRPGIKKGSWTPEEDKKVLALVQKIGKKWTEISQQMPTRTGKQIRDRYINSLEPSINKSRFTDEEDRKIISLLKKYGKAWSGIASELPGRTADMIKNRFYCTLKYYLQDERNFLGMKRDKELNNEIFKIVNVGKTSKEQAFSNLSSIKKEDNCINTIYQVDKTYTNLQVSRNSELLFPSIFPNNNENEESKPFIELRSSMFPDKSNLFQESCIISKRQNEIDPFNSKIIEETLLLDEINRQQRIDLSIGMSYESNESKGNNELKKFELFQELLCEQEKQGNIRDNILLQLSVLKDIKGQIETKSIYFS